MEGKTYKIRVNVKNGEIEVEGDKDFVRKEIKDLLEIISKKIKVETTIIGEESGQTEKASTKKDRLHSINEGASDLDQFNALTEFFKYKSPKKVWEKALVVAYWITYKENISEFSPSEISDRLKKIGVSPPGNPWDVLKKLASAKKAYLLKGNSRGKYKMGMLGKEYVENELPKSDKK